VCVEHATVDPGGGPSCIYIYMNEGNGVTNRSHEWGNVCNFKGVHQEEMFWSSTLKDVDKDV
jgi:hypothetical protein